ncbi:MAG TPA: glycosyltransferase family 39 protein [Phycisphaerae bacterium]|nr:glycosyltransferase family 39 protein [Phycisphaerae bacterium]
MASDASGNVERRAGSSGWRWALAGIIVFGVAIRVGLGLVHPYMFDDSRDYVELARRIVHGLSYGVQTRDGWMTASRMPGYPVFLAGVFAVFGESVKAVACVQAILSGGIIWLTWLIGRRAGVMAGLIAAGLVAMDPLTVGFSAAILSEMPFTLCLMGGMWIGARLLERERGEVRELGWWIVLGLVWGAGVYLRASVLYALVVVGVWIWGYRRFSGWALGGALLAVVVMFGTLVPWMMHTGKGAGRLTSLEGISLYEAVYPGADGGPKQDKIATPPEMEGAGMEWPRDEVWGREAWGYVRSDPVRILRLAVVKAGRTWSPWMNASEMRNPVLQAVLIGWQAPLFILAAGGIFWGGLAGRMKGLLLCPIVYFTAVHALFLGSVRYRVPLMPVVCVLAATGLARLVRRAGKPEPDEGV